MFALLLTIACSTSIALILKYNDTRDGNPLVLLTANYFIAAIISFIFLCINPHRSFSMETLLFGASLAILFVVSFFAFAKAVRIAGTALATVSSRLSVIVPLLLSILIFKEKPSSFQAIGIMLAFITIGLFYQSIRNSDSKEIRLLDYIYLLIVLLGIGVNDFGMKIFQQWRPTIEKPYFIFIIFLFCFMYTFIVVVIKGVRMDKPVLVRGAILGIPNMFSTFFILLALGQLPAIVVYPTVNIGIILLTTLGAAILWKEKMNRSGLWALQFGMAALILLSIS
jgi:drug/metabolite transporter (DMT)-like permease